MSESLNSLLRSDLVTVSQPRSTKINIIGIEVVAALCGLSMGLVAVINTNLMIDKFCKNDLNYSEVICNNLMDEKYETIQNQVQAEVTKLNMYSTIISSVPAIILSLILGPASDRLGRKVVLGFPLFGLILAQLILVLNVYYMSASATYVLFVNIYGFFGGMTCFFIGMYSYMVDISNEETRTTRISILDASMTASLTLGIFSSAYIYNYLGYYGIYITTTCILTLDLLVVLFVLESSTRTTRTANTETTQPRTSILRTVFRKRCGYRRLKLMVCILSFVIYIAVFAGDFDYLYTRKILDWDEQTFTKVASIGTIIKCISSLFALPVLSYYLELSDHLLGWCASLSMALGQLFIAVARTSSVYVMGVVYGGLTSMTSSILRSLMSKQVPKEELGQVFSFLGFMEGLTPLVVAPLATLLYNYTLYTNPSTIYYFRTTLALACSLGFIIFKGFERKENSQRLQPSEISPLLHNDNIRA